MTSRQEGYLLPYHCAQNLHISKMSFAHSSLFKRISERPTHKAENGKGPNPRLTLVSLLLHQRGARRDQEANRQELRGENASADDPLDTTKACFLALSC